MATHQQSQFADTPGPTEVTESRQTGQLLAEIEIKSLVRDSCPVAKFGDRAVSGDIQLTGDHCHVSLENSADSEHPALFTTALDQNCACTAACAPGITPSYLVVEDGNLILKAFVDSRERLHHLTENLDDTTEEWHLRKLRTVAEYSELNGTDDKALPEEISLTDKQREVVQLAVNLGYYSNPRQISLGELADEVGVTKAAVSQRLNAVEAKLIDELAGEL